MIVAGVMSGTSADGIDVALIRIAGKAKIKLIGHASFSYPHDVRRAVLAAMNSPSASVADLARLNFRLGELYADAVLATQKKLRTKADLIGCHGQTIYHQGTRAAFLGKKIAATWQTGEGAVVAARTGIPVVSDFRPADMSRGGKGAPLVPYLDYLLYRDRRIGRIALNLGGVANVTAIPAAAKPEDVIAFDTGPGNMVIDSLANQLFGVSCDRGGKIAASGEVSKVVIAESLRAGFFRAKPPKTAGREEFGREFSQSFRKALNRARPSKIAQGGASLSWKRNAIATATALTAGSIAAAIRRFVLSCGAFSEIIASGGGTRNATLMKWLAREVRGLGLKVRLSEEFGVPSQAKEAVAFAVLAFETWNRRPSNVPSATGAKQEAVLGKISYP
jgi:anhydro-N-acetylmuramic acid kinase